MVMTNSVDPDQTAPQEQSDLGLHCLHMPFLSDTLMYKILGHLPNSFLCMFHKKILILYFIMPPKIYL